ncbi:hypothetical protein F5148DRAFT_1281206 [Russula earlei]|uniref:Uncharacterized protein n=1 Tax=Russula earlei TaxID=71964 RepID=A0ACC0UJM6_9AGAM|nr:hypothetical protein F5148DRAFT_1281206 [Russula earlei]
MATQTHPTPSAFSRVRFGFGPKPSRSRLPPETPENAEVRADWYIPYNGPYELPPAAPRSKNRDSWGQLLGSVLGNVAIPKSSVVGHQWSDVPVASEKIMSALPGSDAFSSHPYRMSAITDPTGIPGPAIMASQGYGASSSSQPSRGGGRQTLITSSTSFANIDTTGGVGESPTPVQRTSPLHSSPPSSSSNRLSLGSFLTFGGSTRKSRSDSVYVARQPSAKHSHNGTPTPDPLHSNRATSIDAQSVSFSQSFAPRPTDGTQIAPAVPHFDRHFHATSATLELPVAHQLLRPPPCVPLDKGKGVDRSYPYPRPPPLDTLNNPEIPAHLKPASRTSLFKTISAPNLRNLSRGLSNSKHAPSRGKYRWLSPETWCDALLFPRPRFLAYVDDDPPQYSHRQTPPIQPTESHAASERPKPNQTAMRGSRSAVNLHAPNSESSQGPPRAEPMLMARSGPFDVDGLPPSDRPRSFAQDDLALPSPVPSLARVLEMGASFERERATWKAHAARSMQSSRLTRSLGRSRSQTLLGNQLYAPTVHTRTSSDGTQTQQTRSGTSHARTTSSGGISRAGSKGNVALRAATGLCISGDKMSPQDRPSEAFSRIDDRDKVIRIGGRAPNADVGPSPSPPMTSNANVGVALSSPPDSAEGSSTEGSSPVYVPNHPYAQSGHSGSRRSHTRSSSDYAGPHPSAISITAPAVALVSDMSARHRLPPHVALHPYASALAYPNPPSQHPSTILPVVPKQSPKQSYHAPTEHVLSSLSTPQNPPKPRPQLWDTREFETGLAAPHAYASGDRVSGEPLAFADALSLDLQRRGSADSGLGESENQYETPASAAQPYSPLPRFAFITTPERQRHDASGDPKFLSMRSGHTATSSEMLNPPVFTASVLSYSHPSAPASLVDEPLPCSRASSPQQSPRPFSTIEDLDRYRNLFYRPRGSGSSRTPSVEHRRVLSRDNGSLTGVDTGSNSHVSGGSGLASLTRQLSNELEAIQDMHSLERTGSLQSSQPRMWGLRYGSLRGGDGLGTRTDPNAVLSITSDSEMTSLDATRLPLSLHRSGGHQSEGSLTFNIPQDVDSQTSSVLERSEVEDVHHDEVLRMGTVEAVSTPPATIPAYRLSFMGDVQGHSQESLLRVTADTRAPSTPSPILASIAHQGSRTSLLPAALPSATTEATRSSYLTDGTGTSRISGLSDFPAPPTQTVVSSDRVEVLNSYFDDAHSRPVSRAEGPSGTVASPSPPPASGSESDRLSEERPAGKVDPP